MKLHELFEARQSLLDYVTEQFPNWPSYIVRDFLYQQAKMISDHEHLEEWLADIKYEYGHIHWEFKKLPITFESFTPDTQRRFKERKMGEVNPYGVHKDAQRHATQQAMITQRGVSPEPIIVVVKPDGLELIEGWHRTMQHLRTFPKGYTGPAWVGK